MVTKLRWNPEDPATPALIDSLLEDMGLGAEDELRSESPEQKAEAKEATKSYLLFIFNKWDFCSMGDWNSLGYPFYYGYLAGLTRNQIPSIS
jgi:hypothetical protein